MKMKRKQFELNDIFTPGVRLTTREGAHYEVTEGFHGIFANNSQTGEIIEPNDYNVFLCHKTNRIDDIIAIDIHIELKDEACPIDELKGGAVVTALEKYAAYLELNVDVSPDDLIRYAKLMRTWFDVNTGEPLREEGYNLANMTSEDFEFAREIERLKNK